MASDRANGRLYGGAAASLKPAAASGYGRPEPEDGPVFFAAVDLGTNNCRLLIARPEGADLRVVDAFSRIVRLGERLDRRQLSPAAMSRAISALAVCARKIRRWDVRQQRCVATGACRIADNREEFCRSVAARTGIQLEVISGKEEARLAVTGARQLLDPDHSHCLVFDIGGSTTELIWAEFAGDRQIEILDSVSLPFGVATLAGQNPCEIDTHGRFQRTVADVGRAFERFEAANNITYWVERGRVHLIGTSGTTTTLAGIHLGLRRYDRSKVDGLTIDRRDFLAAIDVVSRLTISELAANGCVGSERADWVLPGAAILSSLLAQWPCHRLTVADRGLRDGILRDMITSAGYWTATS